MLRLKPLKLLCYEPILSLEQGGKTRAIINLYEALLIKKKIILTILTKSNQTKVLDLFSPKLKAQITLVSDKRLTFIKLKHLIQSVDLVHSHELWSIKTCLLAIVSRKLNIPFVISLHGMLNPASIKQKAIKKKIFLYTLGSIIFSFSQTIHCTSQTEKQQINRFFQKKSVILPLIIYTELTQTRCNLKDNKVEKDKQHIPTLLYLGRLHPTKGIELLIDAIDALRSRKIKVKLMLVGSGRTNYLSHLQRTIESKQLTNQITFSGFIDGKQKITLYQSADLLVHLSEQESFGLSVFEALIAGTPVVITKTFDWWQFIETEQIGLVVSRDPEQIANSITSLLDNIFLYNAMKQKTHVKTIAYFSTDTLVEKYSSFYTQLINNTGT